MCSIGCPIWVCALGPRNCDPESYVALTERTDRHIPCWSRHASWFHEGGTSLLSAPEPTARGGRDGRVRGRPEAVQAVNNRTNPRNPGTSAGRLCCQRVELTNPTSPASRFSRT